MTCGEEVVFEGRVRLMLGFIDWSSGGPDLKVLWGVATKKSTNTFVMLRHKGIQKLWLNHETNGGASVVHGSGGLKTHPGNIAKPMNFGTHPQNPHN